MLIDTSDLPILIEETVLRSDGYVFPIELPAGQDEDDWSFVGTVKAEASADDADVLASFTFDTSAWPVVLATLSQEAIAGLGPDHVGAALRLVYGGVPTTVVVWTWKLEDSF